MWSSTCINRVLQTANESIRTMRKLLLEQSRLRPMSEVDVQRAIAQLRKNIVLKRAQMEQMAEDAAMQVLDPVNHAFLPR